MTLADELDAEIEAWKDAAPDGDQGVMRRMLTLASQAVEELRRLEQAGQAYREWCGRRDAAVEPRPAEAQQDPAAELGITPLAILGEMQRIAMFDTGQAYGEGGLLRAVPDMPEEVRRSIVSLEVVELWLWDEEQQTKVWKGYTKKIKFRDADRMLELLGKHLGLLVDRLKVDPSEDWGAMLRQAREGRERVTRMRSAVETTLLTGPAAAPPIEPPIDPLLETTL